MLVFYVVFYVIALVLFALDAMRVNSGRVNLLAAGLFFWTLTPLFMVINRL